MNTYPTYERRVRTGLAVLQLVLAGALAVALVLLATTAWSANTTHTAPWGVRILPVAVVHTPQVRLGDIAEPFGPVPAGEWERLRERVVWNAPADERIRPYGVDKRELEWTLVSRLGADASRISVRGPLAIQYGGSVLSADAMRDAIVEYLTPLLAPMDAELDLQSIRMERDIFVAERHARMEVRLDEGDAIAPGRLNLRVVAVAPDGTELRDHSTHVWVDQWASVPVAARPLSAGDVVHPQDVQFKRVNLAHTRGTPWEMAAAKTRTGGARRVVAAVAMGQPLLVENLAAVPMITRGERIELVYRGKRIRLSVEAEALADGQAGDEILVRNVQSDKQVLATVWDASTVVVE